MRLPKNLLFAGVAAFALAGGATLLAAQPLHTMLVRLPDGGLAQIRYAGDAPPQIAFAPEPLAAAFGGPDPAFAMLDRISAQMDREMDALMSEATGPLAGPERLFAADMRDAPAGVADYAFVSTLGGDGTYCARSVEVTRPAPGARARVVTHMSGDCRGVGRALFGVAPPPRAAAPAEATARPNREPRPAGPRLIEAGFRPPA
jgi:hypothetical protein